MRNIFLFLSMSFLALPLRAHKGHHMDSAALIEKKSPTADRREIFQAINLDYQKDIAPLLKESCLNCHGSSPNLPWYDAVPGAHQLMEHDMKEAKEHLDMSSGFPFQGHGTVEEDLKALQKVLKENSMPPLRYRLLHWNSGLTQEQKRIVLNWTEKSLERVGAQKGPE